MTKTMNATQHKEVGNKRDNKDDKNNNKNSIAVPVMGTQRHKDGEMDCVWIGIEKGGKREREKEI